ncbi:octopamine receptor Oamb-like isoform X2 [Aedes albopictus]|uniref:G-protein coupled receptors family 1 profile domain-containing protein n=1 Tax=Aedes albopictus TaxID=7160 RepID=A0ABM1Z923_AEDAL|nr:octopamine receptor Oamb-like isoform X2 [Aedes albopictus]
MNATECHSLIASVEWTEPRKILLLAILIFIDVLVIVGNTLVVAAVTSSHKLRSVTNFFIVSLAVADLLVGLAVLPFSATWEVFKVWIFGDVWCRVWLAVDVWMCTASILNLCAISLDRYVAVTRPVTYPSIMSTGRAKSLIAGLWVLSFVICFPPLVGWKEQKVKENLLLPYGNHTLASVSPSPVTSTSSYSSSSLPSLSISFSSSSSSPPSSGSVSSAFSSTITTTITSSSSSFAAGADWDGLGMGDAAPTPNPPCPWTCELTNDAGYVVYSALGSFYIPMFVMLFFYWRIYRAAERTTRAINQGFRTTKGGKKNNNFDDSLTLRMHRGKGVGALMASTMRTHNMLIEGSAVRPTSVNSASSTANANPQISISCPSGNTSHLTSPTVSLGSSLQINLPSQHNGGSSNGGGGGGSGSVRYPPSRPNSRRKSVFKEAPAGISRDLSPNSSKKLGKKHLKVQVKRFRMETKAAKTLAIIVGGFIICWLPFFTMYLIRAFCDDCINDTLFSILFWLGYCNSAVNPFIYALFSRDFRQAFKRIIMRCFCWKRFKINLLKKSSTTQHTNNHSYSPSAFTPLASTPRTELDNTVFR